MARTIIEQPDGLYSVYSSVIDDFVYINSTIDEIIEAYIEDERENIKYRVAFEVERMKKYPTSVMTYEEALKRIKEVHGELK